MILPYKYEKTEKQGEIQCQSTEEKRLEKRKKIFSKDMSIEQSESYIEHSKSSLQRTTDTADKSRCRKKRKMTSRRTKKKEHLINIYPMYSIVSRNKSRRKINRDSEGSTLRITKANNQRKEC